MPFAALSGNSGNKTLGKFIFVKSYESYFLMGSSAFLTRSFMNSAILCQILKIPYNNISGTILEKIPTSTSSLS